MPKLTPTDPNASIPPAVAEDATEQLGEDALAREEAVLATKRRLRILRFKVRWMDTLAEHARRELAAAAKGGSGDDAAPGDPPDMAELDAEVEDQMEVVGEVPVNPRNSTSGSEQDPGEDGLFSPVPVDEE